MAELVIIVSGLSDIDNFSEEVVHNNAQVKYTHAHKGKRVERNVGNEPFNVKYFVLFQDAEVFGLENELFDGGLVERPIQCP